MTTGLPQPSASNFGDKVRELLLVGAGLLGDRRDSFVRVSDLEGAGIAVPQQRFIRGAGGPALVGIGPAVAAPYEIDLTPPPTPTGLLVTAGISKLVIQCDQPGYTQGHGHDRTVVYGATYPGTGPLPTFANAVELTQFQGIATGYATNPATEWHIWIKWKTRDGVLSIAPAGGTNGFTVTTGQDVSLLLNALTAAAQSPTAPYTRYAVRAGLFYVANDTSGAAAPLFSVLTAPITVNGVAVPAGVYMADAYVMNGTITNAKMANLAVDTAKIADLAVANGKIADLAVDSAKIADLAVTTAKIADLQVSTLKIANNAVTIPLSANVAVSSVLTSSYVVVAETGYGSFPTPSINVSVMSVSMFDGQVDYALDAFCSDGTTVNGASISYGVSSGGFGFSLPAAFMFILPKAGDWKFRLQARKSSLATGAVSHYLTTITAIGVQK